MTLHLSSTRKRTESRYLEAIRNASDESRRARTRDIAKMLDVTPSSVTSMLEKLSEDGLIDYESHHGARLTERGMSNLGDIAQRRDVLRRFFLLLGMEIEVSDVQARRFASIVSDESFRKLKLLNQELEVSIGVDRPGKTYP